MRFGSVCSGIEAASVAWHPMGWRAAWLSEIDASASAVLAHRFPDTPNLGDMTAIAAQIDIGLVEAPELLVGGTPCQGFSVAGRRGGMSDPRGQLTLSFVEIADAIDRSRRAAGQPECIVVWENVPGCLSMRDNSFGHFLAALAGEDVPLEPSGKRWPDCGVVVGPERAIAWRILDAQYVGLAQRRKRVFVVASARDGFDPGEVLLEFEGVRRDSPPSRKAGEDVAGTLDARTDGGGFPGTDGACSGHVVPAGGHRLTNRVSWPAEIAPTLNAHFGDKQRLEDQHVNQGCPLFVPEPQCVTGSVTHCLKAEGFDASEDGTGRGQPIIGGIRFACGCGEESLLAGLDQPCPACTRIADGSVTYAFSAKDYGADATEDMSPTLRAGGHSDSHANGGVMPAVCYAFKPGMSEAAGGLMPTDDVSPTLQAADNGSTRTPAVAYAFQPRIARNGRGDMGECVNALTADAGKTGRGDAAPCVAYAIQERAVCENPDAGPDGMGVRTDDCAYTLEARSVPQAVALAFQERGRDQGRTVEVNGDLAYALTSPQGGGRAQERNIVDPAMAVRRLMPVECERLQGFPDGWTRIPSRHYPVQKITGTRPADMWEPDPNGGWWLMAADGPRYKQLGNSMAVRCMAWIGRRIQRHLTDIAVRELIG